MKIQVRRVFAHWLRVQISKLYKSKNQKLYDTLVMLSIGVVVLSLTYGTSLVTGKEAFSAIMLSVLAYFLLRALVLAWATRDTSVEMGQFQSTRAWVERQLCAEMRLLNALENHIKERPAKGVSRILSRVSSSLSSKSLGSNGSDSNGGSGSNSPRPQESDLPATEPAVPQTAAKSPRKSTENLGGDLATDIGSFRAVRYLHLVMHNMILRHLEEDHGDRLKDIRDALRQAGTGRPIDAPAWESLPTSVAEEDEENDWVIYRKQVATAFASLSRSEQQAVAAGVAEWFKYKDERTAISTAPGFEGQEGVRGHHRRDPRLRSAYHMSGFIYFINPMVNGFTIIGGGMGLVAFIVGDPMLALALCAMAGVYASASTTIKSFDNVIQDFLDRLHLYLIDRGDDSVWGALKAMLGDYFSVQPLRKTLFWLAAIGMTLGTSALAYNFALQVRFPSFGTDVHITAGPTVAVFCMIITFFAAGALYLSTALDFTRERGHRLRRHFARNKVTAALVVLTVAAISLNNSDKMFEFVKGLGGDEGLGYALAAFILVFAAFYLFCSFSGTWEKLKGSWKALMHVVETDPENLQDYTNRFDPSLEAANDPAVSGDTTRAVLRADNGAGTKVRRHRDPIDMEGLGDDNGPPTANTDAQLVQQRDDSPGTRTTPPYGETPREEQRACVVS